MAKILIVGCGDIGFRVALALHKQGHEVTALKRTPVSAPFSVVLADIKDTSAFSTVSVEFDLVLFIVAPASREVEAYRAVYDSGLNNLLSHFAEGGRSPKWLLVSSSSVYAQSRGEWVDESSEAKPKTATAQCLRAAEQRLWEVDSRHCVVRFSGICGPGRDWLIRRAAQNNGIQQRPVLYTNRIHRDDCVAVLLFLIQRQLAGAQLHSCYLASDDEPAPLWEVVNWIAEQYAYSRPIPLSLSDDADQNKRCSNERLKSLGYRFLFPSYRDAYLKSAE